MREAYPAGCNPIAGREIVLVLFLRCFEAAWARTFARIWSEDGI
jgi:hypothetical protein